MSFCTAFSRHKENLARQQEQTPFSAKDAASEDQTCLMHLQTADPDAASCAREEVVPCEGRGRGGKKKKKALNPRNEKECEMVLKSKFRSFCVWMKREAS